MAKQEKNMKVQVISTESIKPSSPTPQHLKTFKLSLLDQLIPAPFAPLVLFYPNCDSSTLQQVLERSSVLKQSLSETLTRFYPLAGSLKDDLSIDCNDNGAYFAVAKVNFHLNDFLKNPDIHSLHHFLPCEATFDGSSSGTRVTNIQVNIFQCGGMAIGLCISHKILDGAAMSTFLKAWTRTTCESEALYPDFIAPSLFPANDLWLRDSSMAMWGSLFKKGKCATRRLVFDALDISNLKAEAIKHGVQNPSRVEVVSAFIWKSAMVASEEHNGAKKPSLLTHVVNLRKRATTTFSENSIGNLIWIASAKNKGITTNSNNAKLHNLVDKVRKSISEINGDFVKKLRGENGPTLMSKSLKAISEYESETDYFAYTSWCKLGLYDVDFGWGKPAWVTSSIDPSPTPVFMNFVILMDTRCGEGIEAWVTLDEQEMNILERDVSLQPFCTLDPSPLRD